MVAVRSQPSGWTHQEFTPCRAVSWLRTQGGYTEARPTRLERHSLFIIDGQQLPEVVLVVQVVDRLSDVFLKAEFDVGQG